jgi:general secretion pathway protein L
MANALLEKLKNWWRMLQAGPLGKFFGWWVEELRQALPASWRRKLQYAMRRVTLGLDEHNLVVGVDENRALKVLGSFPLSDAATLQSDQIHDLLGERELLESPQFLVLGSSGVLRKEMKLPLAAESNLAQVLAFEMDRQTPFRASDVYYDWKVLGRDTQSGQVGIELFVVPRTQVDKSIELMKERGVRLAGVDIVDDETAASPPVTMGLNILPPELRVSGMSRKARTNLALGAAAIILLAAVMVQSLYFRAHQLEELESAIAAVQDEARKVQRIKEQIEDSSEAASFLTVRRESAPLAIELLADITRLLPNDTYLDRLVIGQTSVQLQGKSQNAQQLIEAVNSSELLENASFRGSTRLDARSGLEIFEVNAEVRVAGES